MELILAILGGILVYLLCIRIFGKKKREEEALERRLTEIKEKGEITYRTRRQQMMSRPLFDRTVLPLLKFIGKKVKRIPGYLDRSGVEETELQKQLNQAGSVMRASEYLLLRSGLTLAGLIVSIFLIMGADMTLMNQVLYLLLGAAAPYVLMRFSLSSKVTARKKKIEQQLPDVLDLLSVSVEAGLGFEQAIDYIINDMDGELVNELAITAKEISMGRSRREAFVLLGERCGSDNVKSFVSALVQALDLGISMKTLLSTQAASIRLHRRRMVEEQAMKMSTKMLFPLIFFIFPAIFVVLLGPAFMNILNAF